MISCLRHPTWRYDTAEQLAHTSGAWIAWVAEYREALREAAVDSNWVSVRFDGPAHIPAAAQEFLINRGVSMPSPSGIPQQRAADHVMLYGVHTSAEARARARASPPASPPGSTGSRRSTTAPTGLRTPGAEFPPKLTRALSFMECGYNSTTSTSSRSSSPASLHPSTPRIQPVGSTAERKASPACNGKMSFQWICVGLKIVSIF